MELESYYKDLNSIPVLEWEADELIGRKEFVQILRGAFPSFDENMQACRFKLSPGRAKFTLPSKAFLFTGTEGNGKKTLDNVFSMEMFDKCLYITEADEETPFRYYSIPVHKLKVKKKKETIKKLEEFFQNLSELCNKEEYEGMMIYISLGDIGSLLKHKKIADAITELVQDLLNNDNVIIILTGLCHYSARKISNCVHNIFNVLELEKPNKSQRMVYFATIQEYNPSIRWDISLNDIAEKTNDFTFRMMKKTSENIYSWALGSLRNGEDIDEEEVKDYILGNKEQVFEVPSDVIASIIDNVSKGVYIEKASLLSLQSPLIPSQKVLVEDNSNINTNTNTDEENDDNMNDVLKSLKEKIKCTSDRKNFEKTLYPPIVLNIQTKEGQGQIFNEN